MYIVLEDNDYKEIAKRIEDATTRSGVFYYSDLQILVEYSLHVDGYREDEYPYGSNAWVTTNVELDVKLSLDDCDASIDYSESRIKNEIEKLLY